MNSETMALIELARINSLIADKNKEIAIANRELSLGHWLSDHATACEEINKCIEYHFERISKL